MDTNILGMSFNPLASVSTSSTSNTPQISKDDFMKILLAEISQPNINNIFGGNQSGASNSVFGGTSLSTMLAMSNFFDMTNSGGLSSITKLPILSLLIGKEIKATDSNKNEISGTVQRVLMQNGVAMVDIGNSNIIEADSITEIK